MLLFPIFHEFFKIYINILSPYSDFSSDIDWSYKNVFVLSIVSFCLYFIIIEKLHRRVVVMGLLDKHALTNENLKISRSEIYKVLMGVKNSENKELLANLENLRQQKEQNEISSDSYLKKLMALRESLRQ